eukprot:365467-Chlamydomonas_euryale.AAC.28
MQYTDDNAEPGSTQKPRMMQEATGSAQPAPAISSPCPSLPSHTRLHRCPRLPTQLHRRKRRRVVR